MGDGSTSSAPVAPASRSENRASSSLRTQSPTNSPVQFGGATIWIWGSPGRQPSLRPGYSAIESLRASHTRIGPNKDLNKGGCLTPADRTAIIRLHEPAEGHRQGRRRGADARRVGRVDPRTGAWRPPT